MKCREWDIWAEGLGPLNRRDGRVNSVKIITYCTRRVRAFIIIWVFWVVIWVLWRTLYCLSFGLSSHLYCCMLISDIFSALGADTLFSWCDKKYIYIFVKIFLSFNDFSLRYKERVCHSGNYLCSSFSCIYKVVMVYYTRKEVINWLPLTPLFYYNGGKTKPLMYLGLSQIGVRAEGRRLWWGHLTKAFNYKG